MKLAVVVGIDKNNGMTLYRVISCLGIPRESEDGIHILEKEYDWKFDCKMLPEATLRNMLINSRNNGIQYLNVKLGNNSNIVGTYASLDRFNGKNKPLVFISKIISAKGNILGYKVASYNGEVKNISLKEIVAYGERVHASGGIPVQNAVYIAAKGDKKGFYKEYEDNSIVTEVLRSNKNPYTENKRPNVRKNADNLKNPEIVFTHEQREELSKAGAAGIDVKVIANPKLSAAQMKILRQGMQRGIDVRPFAFPEYATSKMMSYILDLQGGVDISGYLNPKYELPQLLELSIASELGLDLSKMANPELSATAMCEIRERLEAGTWNDYLVDKDGMWN